MPRWLAALKVKWTLKSSGGQCFEPRRLSGGYFGEMAGAGATILLAYVLGISEMYLFARRDQGNRPVSWHLSDRRQIL